MNREVLGSRVKSSYLSALDTPQQMLSRELLCKNVEDFYNMLIWLLNETRHFLIFSSLPVWLMFKSMNACQTLTALLERRFLFYMMAYLLLQLYVWHSMYCPKGRYSYHVKLGKGGFFSF